MTRIAILSAGPSLADTIAFYDPDDYAVSVAVNVAICRAWTTHYCCLDWGSLVRWPWVNPKPILVTGKSKVASAVTYKSEHKARLEGLERVNVFAPPVPHALSEPKTSGPASLIFAISQAHSRGARHIDCYGCDMGGSGHFEPDGVALPKNYGQNRGPGRWRTERLHWARLTKFAARIGITVTRIR